MSILIKFLEFSTTIYVLLYGAAVSFYLVSLFYDRDLGIARYQIGEKASDHYEHEYKEEYDILEERELGGDFLTSLSNCTILEKTPKGKLLLLYNHENECFWYYFTGNPGKSTCPYDYLESAARAYVLKYDCKKLFKEKHKKIESPKRKESKMDDVFAKLKVCSKKNIAYYGTRFTFKGKVEEHKVEDKNKDKDIVLDNEFYDINFATFKSKNN